MAATATSAIDRLPKELFWGILVQIRNISGASSLVSCLRVCKRWYDAVLPLLCHDILVTNSNIETFITQFRRSNGPHVRSLTVSIDSVTPTMHIPIEEADYNDELLHGRVDKCLLLGQLQVLLEKMKSMSRLSIFSFAMLPDPGLVCSWIPIVRSFLESLPDTCIGIEIEIDTSGQSRHPHLCEAVRERLPRLKHLRLCVTTMCQGIFGKGPTPDNTPENTSKYILTDVSSLQTLIVNCMRPPLFCRPDLCCGIFLGDDCDPVLRRSQETRFVLARCMRAFVKQGKCPAIERLWLLDDQPHSEDQAGYNAINRRDIVQNEMYAMPCQHLGYFEDPETGVLLRTPSGEEVVSNFRAIQALAEGETWKETINGFRLPASVLEAHASDMGYIAKALPLLDAESWEAMHPGKPCRLWITSGGRACG